MNKALKQKTAVYLIHFVGYICNKYLEIQVYIPYFPTVPVVNSRSKSSDLHAISRSIDLGARVRRVAVWRVA